jgi:tryptophan synthase alpha chain
VTALSDSLAAARADGRAALVGYLPAGFPTVDGGIDCLRAMVEGGCDVVEVGLPYSDPVLDGPTIQAAADRALRQGTRTADVLRTVEAVTSAGATAVVMTYWNPVLRYGVERFARDLASAGGSGLITPDLTPDEAGEWLAASDVSGLDRIFLVAPSTSDERLARTVAACRGFVYVASVMGVTGARAATSTAAPELVRRTRTVTDLPVCVGLGVSDGAQAAQVASYADGVIVGSAFVRRVLDAADAPAALAGLRALAGELARGVRSAPQPT